MRFARIAIQVILLTGISSVALSDYDSGRQAYDSGRYAEARQLWEDAANKGDSDALYALAKMYAEGLGVLRDYVASHAYFNVAAAKGNRSALEAREILENKMTAEQLAQAEKLATQLHAQMAAGSSPEPEPTDCTGSSVVKRRIVRQELLEGWSLVTPPIKLKYLKYQYSNYAGELLLDSNIAELNRRWLRDNSWHEFVINDCTYRLNFKINGTYRALSELELQLYHAQ